MYIERVWYPGKFNIDIEEDGINNIVKVNKTEIDNKSRKNIASDLRSKIPELTYRFQKGILLEKEQKFNIETIDEVAKFKNSYENVNLVFWKRPYEDMEFRLREGCRYLSLEETHHVIDLIYRQAAFSLNIGIGLWKKK